MGLIDRDDEGYDDFDDPDDGDPDEEFDDDEFDGREFDVRDHVQDTSIPCPECGGKGTVGGGDQCPLCCGSGFAVDGE
jgi:DnaJ-class molecular chaperone